MQIVAMVAWMGLLVLVGVVVADEPTINPMPKFLGRAYLEDCRASGFDPHQLACTTCEILPSLHRPKCLECCSSYRTLEKRSKRYAMAVLIHTGYPEAVGEVLQHDKEKILEEKGSERFLVHEMPADPMSRMMGRMIEPSAIFWFEEALEGSMGLDDLTTKADEITMLTGRGLGRDDIRDMLLALLPDKE